MTTNNSEELDIGSIEPLVGIDKNIPLNEKLLFPTIGGMNAVFSSMVLFYLSYFYINVLMVGSINYYASMFFIVQIAAALLMPAFGVYIDRHTTRWGRYKPWLFISLSGTALGGLLAFIPVNFGEAGNILYATATYSLFSVFLSLYQAAKIGMMAAMTKRQDDRITLAVGSSIWASVGGLVVSYFALPLINLFGSSGQGGLNQAGYWKLMLLSMIVFAGLTFFITKNLNERFIISASSQAKISPKLMAQTLFKNKYALISISYVLILGLCTVIKATMSIYYFQNIFHDTSMMATAVLLYSLPVIIGLFLSPFITKLVSMKKLLLVTLSVNIAASAAIFFIPATSEGAIAFYVLISIGNLFIGFAQPAPDLMLTTAADYGEWKFNTNSGGLFGSLNSLMKTLYSAFNRGIPILIIALIGYSRTAKQQSAATLIGIKFSMSFLPAILFLLLLFIVCRWDMTEKRQNEMVNEIYGSLKSED